MNKKRELIISELRKSPVICNVLVMFEKTVPHNIARGMFDILLEELYVRFCFLYQNFPELK